MTLYRIDLKYVGTDFNGWQSQPDGRSVQDCIEKALNQILSDSVRIVGASRTDSGVHALHQVATLKYSKKELDPYKLTASIEALVPESIGITSIQRVNDDFHPIVSASSKIYRYTLWRGSSRDPFYHPFSWRVPDKIDLIQFEKGASRLIGEHDFRSFCAADSSAKTTTRHINDIKINTRESNDQLVECFIEGNGFLKQMVRAIVGTLVECGLGKRSPDDVSTMLEAKNRSLAGQTAPAKGLCLYKIKY